MVVNNSAEYKSKEEEVSELMNFYQFAYQTSSKYSGTCLFEIYDDNDPSNKDLVLWRTVRCDSLTGNVSVWEGRPPDDNITCHVTLPFKTFSDVFWGRVGCQALVMSGGAKIHNWAYKEALSFGYAFDMSTHNWQKYYEFKESLKSQEQTQLQLQLSETQEIMNDVINNPIANKIENWNENLNENENNIGLTEFEQQFAFGNDFKGLKYINFKNLNNGFGIANEFKSQFLEHCYSYISGFNLEDDCNDWINNGSNDSSTRLLSPIQWRNNTNNINNHSNMGMLSVMSLNNNNNKLSFFSNFPNKLFDYTQSETFTTKMDNFIGKYKALSYVNKAIENSNIVSTLLLLD